jgi:hypothetical protein
MPLTSEQIQILRHSLGLHPDGTGRSYRNRYVCDPNPDLDSLVDGGFLFSSGPLTMYGGMKAYSVTPLGEFAAKPQKK